MPERVWDFGTEYEVLENYGNAIVNLAEEVSEFSDRLENYRDELDSLEDKVPLEEGSLDSSETVFDLHAKMMGTYSKYLETEKARLELSRNETDFQMQQREVEAPVDVDLESGEILEGYDEEDYENAVQQVYDEVRDMVLGEISSIDENEVPPLSPSHGIQGLLELSDMVQQVTENLTGNMYYNQETLTEVIGYNIEDLGEMRNEYIDPEDIDLD